MRPSKAAGRILGGAALASALVLALPGVRVTRADGPLVSELPAGPTCQASASPADPAVLAALVERLAQLEAQPPGPGEPEVVVLNNAGYAYEPAGGTGIRALPSELMRVHREQQEQAQQP